jgi:hypothetical protein
MRTTIRLDEDLLAAAKKHAAESGRTLTSVIADALRETLSRRKESGERKPIRLRTMKGDGVRPGVDLDDTASLLEHMES